MKLLRAALAALLFFSTTVAFAADIKPLVNAAGQVRPAHTGETVGVANGGTGAPSLPSCADSGGNHLNYSGGTWTCGTSTSGGSSVAVKDEGTTLTSGATSIDCVGSGITCTNSGSAVTMTVSGGGGGGGTSAILASFMFTQSGTTVTLQKQKNIASITRLGVGQYRVVYTTPLASANYGLACNGRFADATNDFAPTFGPNRNTATGQTSYSTTQIDLVGYAGGFGVAELVNGSCIMFDPSLF